MVFGFRVWGLVLVGLWAECSTPYKGSGLVWIRVLAASHLEG